MRLKKTMIMKRIVLKVGSHVLTEQNRLAKERMMGLVEFMAELSRQYEIILVSSGAVAAGYTEVKLDKKVIANRQALASIGQPLLMSNYKKKLERFDLKCSQVLLTADDFDSRKRTEHAKHAVNVLLDNNVIPIINENDVTATEELVFGDNDQLSAHVAHYFDADMLVILTDIDGYYDKNPHVHDDAVLKKQVHEITREEIEVPFEPNNAFATGGIATKLKAANFLLKQGKKTYLTSGFDLQYAKAFLLKNDHQGGTLFSPENR